MGKLFSVDPLVDRFKQVGATDDFIESTQGDISWMRFGSNSRQLDWVPLDIEWVYGSDLERNAYLTPDIAYFLPNAFVLSPAAYDVLAPNVPVNVEFLPVELDGQVWQVMHIIETGCDAFDQNESIFDVRPNGRRGIIRKLVLKDSAIEEKRLFKVSSVSGMFTSDEEGSLKRLVEEYGLTGLEFNEVHVS